jgi:signal transduction histidine kinase
VANQILNNPQQAHQAANEDKSRSKLLNIVSHELKTPLNHLLGFSELLKNETLGPLGSEKYREFADHIHESGTKLLDMIDRILTLSETDQNALEMHEQECSIETIIQSAVLAAQKLPGAGIATFQIENDEDLPAIRLDRNLILQALINILSNCIKFSKPSGGFVIIRTGRRRGMLAISISDHGIGMSEADITKALAPFTQVDDRLQRRFDGIGIGMPLAKALTEAHGGTFDIASSAGAGTMVTIALPESRFCVESSEPALLV